MTKEELNRIVTAEGWFNGIDTIQKKAVLTNEMGAHIKAGMFKLLLVKIEEAKKEIARLEASVNRMEAAARAGAVPKPAEGKNSKSADVLRIREEMKAFHGWTISLLESDITILAAVETPDAAGNAVRGLQRSFAELWALRVDAGFKMVRSFPEVFSRVIAP
ncbi:MAG: hypothetical protein JNL62_26010 [Bryobacterales bacterium]|nr:hypothetical protein [Bryobacterales bacterium]